MERSFYVTSDVLSMAMTKPVLVNTPLVTETFPFRIPALGDYPALNLFKVFIRSKCLKI